MSNFFLYTIHDQLAVDCVMQYERLRAEVQLLAGKLRFPKKVPLPFAKSTQRTDRRSYREVLTQADADLIRKHCAKEIALFNYQF